MIWRIFTFLVFQLVAGGLGWWMDGPVGALIGVVLAGLAWFALDLVRGLRVLAWMRFGDPAEAPQMWGLWGELSNRARRLLRQREQQLGESDARLQEFLAAIQASPNGVVLLDAQGRIEWCNATAAAHFGIDAHRDLLQLIGNLVRDPAFAAYSASQDYACELVIPGRQSTASRPVKVSVQLHPYGQGNRLLISRDVTAIEQADVMRRDFVANVSHEIRTPLTVLAGFVETLQTLPLEVDEQKRYLQLMAQQSARMQSLVSDLLTLSRLEGSPLPGTSEWTPVQALLVSCERDARALSSVLVPPAASPQSLEFSGPGTPVEIAGSTSELFSALFNLVSNAVRYTPPGGVIAVKFESRGGGGADFSVSDTGPGIAPEHLSRVTERFYRVDRSRSRESGGTGLGLAIVKHVAQRHGAELRIESRLGQGSTFTISFPPGRIRQGS